jgi:UPF0271 protein
MAAKRTDCESALNMHIDLNCDLGEGMPNDEAIMSLITSANIACGGHAGDEETMRRTVELAKCFGVAIGAHPSFEDRANFGRFEMRLSAAEIQRLVRRQIEALAKFAPLTHVKPHGALYNLAARDRMVADAIASAVKEVDPELVLVGLAGSEMLRAGEWVGLRVASEVFADRTYQSDGSLTPRNQPGALIHDPVRAVEQVLEMVTRGTVRAVDGTEVCVKADTVCLHGDGPHALTFAEHLRSSLGAAGVEVRVLGN